MSPLRILATAVILTCWLSEGCLPVGPSGPTHIEAVLLDSPQSSSYGLNGNSVFARQVASLTCTVRLAYRSDTATVLVDVFRVGIDGTRVGASVIDPIRHQCDGSKNAYSFELKLVRPLEPADYRCEVQAWDGSGDYYDADLQNVEFSVAPLRHEPTAQPATAPN